MSVSHHHGNDNVVIITGAAGGLGSVMALGLLATGSCVVAIDIPAARERMAQLVESAEQAGAGTRLLPIAGDVTSYTDCEAMVNAAISHFGGVHVLVNNAALFLNSFTDRVRSAPPRFTEVPIDRWVDTINVNVNGPFFMARATVPHLIAQKWGRIVNIVTSYGTMIRGQVSPYGQSKAALEASTAIWSADLEGTGVTVNALLPGSAADTSMIPHVDWPDRSTLVKPSAMVAPMVWLASRQSDGVTGRRFIAKDWDPSASSDHNVKIASARSAWRSE
jgi:NAD(P)-dependent dehydrogenase (short-subunit alcohol dehydrogenase family)